MYIQKKELLIIFYVNNLVVFAKDSNNIEKIKHTMNQKLKVKLLRWFNQFFCIEPNWSIRNNVELHQTRLVSKPLSDTEMMDS